MGVKVKAKRSAPGPRRPGERDVPLGPTGLYWPCPGNGFSYPIGMAQLHEPLALAICKGPKRYWIMCPICYTRVTFGLYVWDETRGMTPQQAEQRGMRRMT